MSRNLDQSQCLHTGFDLYKYNLHELRKGRDFHPNFACLTSVFWIWHRSAFCRCPPFPHWSRRSTFENENLSEEQQSFPKPKTVLKNEDPPGLCKNIWCPPWGWRCKLKNRMVSTQSQINDQRQDNIMASPYPMTLFLSLQCKWQKWSLR